MAKKLDHLVLAELRPEDAHFALRKEVILHSLAVEIGPLATNGWKWPTAAQADKT